MAQEAGTAVKVYSALETDRDHYLERARAAAKLTIPALFPPNGMTPSADLYKPFQSLGARGVNTLAAKLLLALMGSTFFRMRPDAAVQEEVDKMPVEDRKALESALAKTESRVMQRIEDDGDSVVVFELLKHLIVGGNCLMYVGKEGSRLYHLPKYVVRRDANGDQKEIVIREEFAPDNLPDDVKEMLNVPDEDGKVPMAAEKTIPVYTHIVRKAGQWFEYQEVAGRRVPGTEAQYPLDACPWLALRLVRIDGEDYGRGFIDEYYGDLRSLESLSKSIVMFSAAAAFILFLVKPNGTTDQRTLSRASSGDVREGNADDVTVLQMQKYNDFQAARTTVEDIKERLSMAFLLTSSIQRNAERVTAEEIREMAKDLDAGMGGVYTLLSKEFQLPFVRRKMKMMEKERAIPRIPRKDVRIVIVTGIEAIGRGHDKRKLMEWVGVMTQSFGPEWVAQNIDGRAYGERLALADDVDIKGLLREPDAVTADQDTQQIKQMIAQMGPEAAKAMMQQQAKGGAPAAPPAPQ